jgi:hypothetical protein
MTPSLDSLEQQRAAVLEEMRSIDRLRRGTLSQHFLKKKRAGQTVTHGPYFILQGFLRGKKFAQHISAEEAPQVALDVKNYQHFQTLAERFIALTDQITRLSGATEQSKKNSSRRKSPTSASGKPKPS